MRYDPHFDRLDAEMNVKAEKKAERRAEFLNDLDYEYMESEIFETEDMEKIIDDNDSEEYCQLRRMGLTHPEAEGVTHNG